jgi:hypothetical protein
MTARAALNGSLARWAFPLALLAYVLVSEIVPPQWHARPWLAGFMLLVVGGAMAFRPTFFAFAHPFGIRLVGIFILGISAFVGLSRLIEIY